MPTASGMHSAGRQRSDEFGREGSTQSCKAPGRSRETCTRSSCPSTQIWHLRDPSPGEPSTELSLPRWIPIRSQNVAEVGSSRVRYRAGEVVAVENVIELYSELQLVLFAGSHREIFDHAGILIRGAKATQRVDSRRPGSQLCIGRVGNQRGIEIEILRWCWIRPSRRSEVASIRAFHSWTKVHVGNCPVWVRVIVAGKECERLAGVIANKSAQRPSAYKSLYEPMAVPKKPFASTKW